MGSIGVVLNFVEAAQLIKDVHHVVVQLINLVETHHVAVILIIKELDQYVVAQ